MTYVEISPHAYTVLFDNGVKMGEILRDHDGFFYFWPEALNGFWAAHIMRQIADKCDELNAPYEKEITLFFEGSGAPSDIEFDQFPDAPKDLDIRRTP